MPIREEDREKTSFFNGSRLMQFKKMPQGYKNSPAIFQKNMNIILNDLIYKKCLVYIDDILVFGKTLEECESNTKEVETRLNLYELVENKNKRISGVEEIQFLGYTISYNTI